MHDFVHKFSHSFMHGTAVTALAVSLAVFGVGMLNLSQQVEVAILQTQFAQMQTASVVLADSSNVMPPRPEARAFASTSLPMASSTMASSSLRHEIRDDIKMAIATSCPPLPKSLAQGTRDATSTGDVHLLQMFLANHFNLKSDDVVTGYYGSTTASYVAKFQAEQGLDKVGIAGALTRAAIVRVCNATMPPPPPKMDGRGFASSTASSTASTTRPWEHPMPPRMHPEHPTSTVQSTLQSLLNADMFVASAFSNAVGSLGDGVANVWTGYSELFSQPFSPQ